MVVRFLAFDATQSARPFACFAVMYASTSTASLSPYMSVEAIAWKYVSWMPGGRLAITIGMPGVTNTSQLSTGVSAKEDLGITLPLQSFHVVAGQSIALLL